MRFTDREYEELREEVAGRVVFDPCCADCRITFEPVEGAVADPSRDLYIVPCAACAGRRPFSWVRDVPIDALRKFCEEHSDAFLIEDLRPLVPKRRGFEFL